MSKIEFIEYYSKNLNLPEEEFKRFIEVLETPLPHSFRIINTPFYEKVKMHIDSMPSVKRIDYIKDTYFIDKSVEESDKNKNFIINQTLLGTIQRQEIVSMIPILLMGLKEKHYVLDLCAAPGSKTKQILNIVGKEGLIVANDASSKRINILMTETFKIPHESFLVTQHDASKFPSIKMTEDRKFDRVLCDVPCSSDGTIRKNPCLLTEWNAKKAQGLFDLQYRILKRSIDLVEDDGIIIYSTCSLNPLENECVVQNIVLNENLEIVDPFTYIDNDVVSKDFFIKRGLKKWDVGEFKHKSLSVSPTTKEIHLDRCLRIYPHDFNTGGFFITLLRKKNKNTVEYKKTTPKPLFKDVSQEESYKILENYELNKNINLVRRYKANNIIYRVSEEVKHIIHNNRLKIVYFGYKFFEKCNINETGFRVKNILYEKDIKIDLEVELDSIKPALESKTLEMDFPKKSVIIKITDLGVCISGYSTGKKIMLYVCNNLQKALLDFTTQ
ncbi:Multisite-specific tRNA:(cytosine-C(5))-methyltransferase [Nosema granulosis]|uniref:Multisite-specific tRNA:(Cytosine-C(5))-methyltransferase n=1 Tax=Nosema granulosis TaxID=83296 RepID=A0A9P6H221_9MICR|nr:Multisite-specific tRNA:(cytosine-C(5))-methyltransferase [Nosema granulosis]